MPSSLRSRPAQNAGSAPVRIRTSTSSRLSASCITFGSRRSSSLDRALRALGRLSVMVAMRSLTSSSTGAADVVLGHAASFWSSDHSRLARRRRATRGSSVGAAVLGRQEREAQVAEAHQRRRDPAAEGAEVLVEQRAGAVGERLLGQLVEALVGDLDGVLELGAPRRRRAPRRGRGGRSRPSARPARGGRRRSAGWTRAAWRTPARARGCSARRWMRSTISISIAGGLSSSSSTYQRR